VDIDDAKEEVFGDLQQAEKSGEGHEVAAGCSELLEDGVAEGVQIAEVFRPNDSDGQSGGSGAFHASAVSLAGDDLYDFGVQASLTDVFEEIEECGAATDDEYGK